MDDSNPGYKDKEKLNYDAIRKNNQKRLKEINNIFIEAELSTTGLNLVLKDVRKRLREGEEIFTINAPSVKNKDKPIRRKTKDVCNMLESRINSKEYIQSLVFAISLTEEYISDAVMLIIRAHPHKLLISPKGRELKDNESLPVDMREIISLRSIDALIQDRARQRVNEAMYAQPKAYFGYLKSVLSFEFPDGLLEQFAEIKATRDIYVHGDGSANDIYIRKAGDKARASMGRRVPVDADYLKASITCMKRIFSSIYRGLMDNFGDSRELQRILALGVDA